MYDLIYRNIFSIKAIRYGMADSQRYWFWWEIAKCESRGRITAEEADHLRECLVFVTRVIG